MNSNNGGLFRLSTEFKKFGRKASVECLTSGVSHLFLNDYFITTTQDLLIDFTFSVQPEASKIHDPKHGYLKCVTVRYGEKSIVLEQSHFIFNLFLDCFAQEVISVKEQDEFVFVTKSISFMQDQLLSDMLLRVNFSILDGNNSRYSSASRLLALLENGKTFVLYRDFIEKSLRFFNSESLLFTVTKIGDETENENLLSSLCNNG